MPSKSPVVECPTQVKPTATQSPSTQGPRVFVSDVLDLRARQPVAIDERLRERDPIGVHPCVSGLGEASS